MNAAHASAQPRGLGAATEARIMAAFATACVIPAEAAADLLGQDTKTLRAMTEAGIIRAVRRGAASLRGYTEGDIRAYLTESAAPCRSINPPKARTSHTTSPGKVVDFTARRAAKRAARPNK